MGEAALSAEAAPARDAPEAGSASADGERAVETAAPRNLDADETTSTTTSRVVFNTTVTENNVPTVLSKLQKWGDYASFGEPALLAFHPDENAALAHAACQSDAIENVLSLPSFLEQQRALGRNVGLIIDLSNHDCLYTDGVPQELERPRRNVESPSRMSRAPPRWCEWQTSSGRDVRTTTSPYTARTGSIARGSSCVRICGVVWATADEALENFAAARPPGVKHERFKVALARGTRRGV